MSETEEENYSGETNPEKGAIDGPNFAMDSKDSGFLDFLNKKIEKYYSQLQSKDIKDTCEDSLNSFYKCLLTKGRMEVEKKDEFSGEKVHISMNEYRASIETANNLIMEQPPSYQCSAVSSGVEGVQNRTEYADLLEHYSKEKGLYECVSEAVTLGSLCGLSWVYVDFNPFGGKIYNAKSGVRGGSAVFKCLSQMEVIYDLNARSFKDINWLIVKERVDKHELASQHKDYAEKIKSNPKDLKNNSYFNILGITDTSEALSEDEIFLYTLWHKSTSLINLGRCVKFISSCVLSDEVNKYEGFPLGAFYSEFVPGTSIPYTNSFDMLALQKALDVSNSAIMTNVCAYGTPSVVLNSAAKLNPRYINNSVVLTGNPPPNGKMVETITFPSTPPDVYKFQEMLKRAIREQKNISDTLKGDPKSNLRSAAALSIVVQQAIRFNSRQQGSYVKLMEKVGKILLETIKINTDESNMVSSYSSRKSGYVKVDTDFLKYANNVEVRVELGNPLTSTQAGKLQILEVFQANGWIDNPAKYIEAVNSNRVDDVFKAEIDKEISIRRECQMLSEGKKPDILEWDDHPKYIRANRALLEDKEVRGDAKKMAVIAGHIKKRVEMWKKLTIDEPALLNVFGIQPYQDPRAQVMEEQIALANPGQVLPQQVTPPPVPPNNTIRGQPRDPLTGQVGEKIKN